MRRIALVCDWYHPRRGGIEAHLDGLATRFVARGHSVVAITSTPGPDTVNGVRVHRLAGPRIPFAGVAAMPAARDIRRILVAERIDMVHSHVSIVSPVALAGALAAQRLGLPSVLTFHSFVPATPLLAGSMGWILNTWTWRAVMTAVSRRVAREVEGFAPRSAFSILPNAIDTTFWTPPTSNGPRDSIHLVFAGRLQAKKRPLLLLRVLQELVIPSAEPAPSERSDEGRDLLFDWRLTIVGEGPLDTELRNGIRAMGVDDRVSFLGWVDQPRLREVLRTADVFLSTAARESFGLAALEARACGVPVVAVEDSAVSDFITHEVSGLLARSNADFAAATARLVRDADLRHRIADFNRRTPVPYDWDRSIATHDDTYEKAAALVTTP